MDVYLNMYPYVCGCISHVCICVCVLACACGRVCAYACEYVVVYAYGIVCDCVCVVAVWSWVCRGMYMGVGMCIWIRMYMWMCV